MRDTIIAGAARCIFGLEYADENERLGAPLQGEIMDQLPSETPAPFEAWAEKTIKAIEGANGADISELFCRACAVEPSKSWENQADQDSSEDARIFGHYLAMEFLGHGVAWDDDHPPHGLEIPYGEGPMAYLCGEVEIDDKEGAEFGALLSRFENAAAFRGEEGPKAYEVAEIILEPFDGDREAIKGAIGRNDIFCTAEGFEVKAGALAWALQITQ